MPAKLKAPEGYINITDLAAEWRCDGKMIRGFVSHGMPHIKKGGQLFFKLEECKKWYRGEASS